MPQPLLPALYVLLHMVLSLASLPAADSSPSLIIEDGSRASDNPQYGLHVPVLSGGLG